MSTSGTSTFEESRDDLIAEALENVGAIGPGDTRNSNNSILFDSAARALNRVVKSVDKDGRYTWRIVRRTTTTTSGTATFSPAADVLDIDEPMSYLQASSSTRTQIMSMSRDDYMRLADRTTSGMPRQFMVERTLSGLTVTFWPVADTTGDTIEYAACLRGQDFASGAETPDFPSKWTHCLVYGLTVELAAKFRQASLIVQYKPMFEDELKRLLGNDSERGNMIFMPAYYGGGAG